jgi:1-aminocyclopropane-1-carboxylate deaminase/D-cysteine desulfhydrase-like pyridoxal-dependent ACC family enzyme
MANLGKLSIEMFSEELIALREEIQHHHDLLVILHGQPDKDVYIHIAEIAAYCGVILDGSYSRDEIITLCDVLTKALKKKNDIIIY